MTGAPRPLGRSRLGPTDSHKQQQRVRKPRHSVFVAVTPGSAQELVALQPNHNSQGSFERFHEASIADSAEVASMLLDEQGSSRNKTPDCSVVDTLDIGFPKDATDLIGGPNARASFPLELEAADFDAFCGGFQPASEPLFALSGPNHPSLCEDPAFLLQSLPENTLEITTRLPPEPSFGSSSNALVQLARINEKIAHQLAHMDTFTMSIPPPNLISSCVDKVSDSQSNPILVTLESTSELAAIVKQIISPIQEHGSSPPLNVPVVLMCLSSHIQLLQLYNSIFSHVLKFLAGLRDIPSFFENMPGFNHMSGLPPIQGDLYIKLIIQVVRHNIESVERRLGLPADLCLAAPQRLSPNGLLSHVGSLETVQSIMDQACSPSEKSGRALVASLRTRIREVLGILGDNS